MRILELPDDVLELIAFELHDNPADILLRFGLCCRAFHRISTLPSLWRNLCFLVGAVEGDEADATQKMLDVHELMVRYQLIASKRVRFDMPENRRSMFRLTFDDRVFSTPRTSGPRLVWLVRQPVVAGRYMQIDFCTRIASNPNFAYGVIHDCYIQNPEKVDEQLMCCYSPGPDMPTPQDQTRAVFFQSFVISAPSKEIPIFLNPKKIDRVSLRMDFVARELQCVYDDGKRLSALPCLIPPEHCIFAICPYLNFGLELLPPTSASRAWFSTAKRCNPWEMAESDLFSGMDG